VHTLVKEEVRDNFIGKEAFRLIKTPGQAEQSPLAQNIKQLLESF
jgi:hypothetical protein